MQEARVERQDQLYSRLHCNRKSQRQIEGQGFSERKIKEIIEIRDIIHKRRRERLTQGNLRVGSQETRASEGVEIPSSVSRQRCSFLLPWIGDPSRFCLLTYTARTLCLCVQNPRKPQKQNTQTENCVCENCEGRKRRQTNERSHLCKYQKHYTSILSSSFLVLHKNCNSIFLHLFGPAKSFVIFFGFLLRAGLMDCIISVNRSSFVIFSSFFLEQVSFSSSSRSPGLYYFGKLQLLRNFFGFLL